MIKKIVLVLVGAFVVIACGASGGLVSEGKVKEEIKLVNHSKKESKPTPTKKVPVKKVVKKEKKEVLTSTSRTVVSKDVVYNYVQDYKNIAMRNMRDYKIPASIILAQGILESGSGRGSLSSRSNNHFGIKCHTGWTGQTATHDDDKKGECFRKYNDPAESYRDHALFLTGRKRYNSLFELDEDDYKAWARGLRKAGYATDPKYPNKLISLIERYNLQDYDTAVLGNKNNDMTDVTRPDSTDLPETIQPVVPAELPQEKVNEVAEFETEVKEVVEETEKVAESKEQLIQPVPTESIRNIPIEDNTDVIVEQTAEELIIPGEQNSNAKQAEDIIHTNDVQSAVVEEDFKMVGNHKLYKVVKGDTVYGLSRRFGVGVNELVKLNQLKDYSLAIGQILRIK